GALYTSVTGVSTLIGQWHRPSDVAAAVLVVVAWTAVACALAGRAGAEPATATAMTPLVRGRPGSRDGGTRAALTLLLTVGAAALGAGGVVIVRLWTFADDHALIGRPSEQLAAYAGGAVGVSGLS